MSPNIARKVINSFGQQSTIRKIESLTDRQHEILTYLVEGLSYKMIAGRLSISENTVSDHIKKIYKKLQVNSKAEAINIALRNPPEN